MRPSMNTPLLGFMYTISRLERERGDAGWCHEEVETARRGGKLSQSSVL